MKKWTFEVDCPEHGRSGALPVIDGKIVPYQEWPADVEQRPRICVKCVAASMVQPIRRSAA